MSKELVIGKKYGRLTYLREIPEDKKPQQGHFLCDCGNTKILRLSRVKTGDVKSCGCLQREAASKANKKHGMTGTREYRSWDSMMQRCNNPKNDRYADYGGRGIHVCQEWHDFTNFYADMGDRPDGATLDRIDNELGYSRETVVGRRQLSNRLTEGNIKVENQNIPGLHAAHRESGPQP